MTTPDAEAGMPGPLVRAMPRAGQIERAACALLFLYPVVLFHVREGVNICFAVLVVLACGWLVATRAPLCGLSRGEGAYAAAMASLTAAIFVSQCWHLNFRSSPYDEAIRYLLAVPVYLMLRAARRGVFAGVQYGIPLGAIAAALMVLPQLPLAGVDRASTPYMDAIRFGDLSVALGTLAVAALDRSDPARLSALKLVGAAAALFAALESGTRGGWIALPVVALLWWWLRGRSALSWAVCAVLAATLATAAVMSYLLVAKVHDRVAGFYSDVVSLLHGNLDTSLGVRFQIWRVAVRLFAENPIFGIGPDEFKSRAVAIGTQGGLFTSEGLYTAQTEVHSQVLREAVSLGVFGIAAIVLIYAVPLLLFVRAASSPAAARSARQAGFMGACFVASFVVFGLTVEIFNLKLIATFYSLTVAVLLAAVARKPAPA